MFWTFKTAVFIAVLFSMPLVHTHYTNMGEPEPRHTTLHPEHNYYEFGRTSQQTAGTMSVVLGRTMNLGANLYGGATEGTQWVADAVDEREKQAPSVAMVRISDRFGMRFHPILRRYKMHNGVDFAAPRGTKIRSVADGKVTYAGWRGGAGRFVKIQHDGYVSTYAHLSRFKVKRGDTVAAGDTIGGVGASGLATGNHLHFSIRVDGKFVDPIKDGFDRLEPLHEAQILVDFERGVLSTLTSIHVGAVGTLSPEEIETSELDSFFDDSFL